MTDCPLNVENFAPFEQVMTAMAVKLEKPRIPNREDLTAAQNSVD
jgi:hypothetical protein